jgi:hypothetical protein
MDKKAQRYREEAATNNECARFLVLGVRGEL